MVADAAAMERFYCDVLGLTVQTRIVVDRPGYSIHETVLVIGEPGGTLLSLVQHLDRPCPAPAEALIGLSVADLEAAIGAVVTAGGAIVTPPADLPQYALRIAIVHDPEGHRLELVQQLTGPRPVSLSIAEHR